MQVNPIGSQSFRAINTKKVSGELYTRLKNPMRYVQYSNLEFAQQKNNLIIDLEPGLHNSFKASIINEIGEVLYKAEENKWRGRLNLSPIKFITNICRKADELSAKVKNPLKA